MALCNKLLKLLQNCGGLSGGIARLWLYDPQDLDFTQAAFSATSGWPPYTAVALVTGASAAGGGTFGMQFERNEAEFTFKQSRKGSFTKYELQLEFKLSHLRNLITNWNYFLDQLSVCCGVGVIVQLNSGIILVLGEAVVNAGAIAIPLYLTQDGSSGTSGKLFDDFNGQTVVIKGDYNRLPFEFTGGLAAIVALQV